MYFIGEMKTYVHVKAYTQKYRSFIHKSSKQETIQKSINKKMDKPIVYPCRAILLKS